jgi:hypothetical protein
MNRKPRFTPIRFLPKTADFLNGLYSHFREMIHLP